MERCSNIYDHMYRIMCSAFYASETILTTEPSRATKHIQLWSGDSCDITAVLDLLRDTAVTLLYSKLFHKLWIFPLHMENLFLTLYSLVVLLIRYLGASFTQSLST